MPYKKHQKPAPSKDQFHGLIEKLLFFGVPSCRQIGTLEHAGISAYAFSCDGCSLAIGDDKKTIVVWDLDRVRLGYKGTRHKDVQATAKSPTQAQFAQQYEMLGGADSSSAHNAMNFFEDYGDHSVEFLETR